MKHSFFDLWNDHKINEKDLPEYYQTSQDPSKYINTNRDSGEGWAKEESWNFSGFGFTGFEDTEYDNDMSHPYECEDDYPQCVFGLKRSSSYEEMKKAYRKAILESHPDKGGDPEEFRIYRQAWEDYES
jgi:hypothetical protein